MFYCCPCTEALFWGSVLRSAIMRSMASRHAIPHITIKSYSLGVCTAPILLVKAGAAATAFFLEKESQGKMLHRAHGALCRVSVTWCAPLWWKIKLHSESWGGLETTLLVVLGKVAWCEKKNSSRWKEARAKFSSFTFPPLTVWLHFNGESSNATKKAFYEF